MIKVSVMYPNSIEATFDMEYYCNTHIPLVAELLGDVLKSKEIDYGLTGGLPDIPAPFIAMAHMKFDSIEIFQQAFTPHAPEILSDIPNFTNIQPQIQISEIKI